MAETVTVDNGGLTDFGVVFGAGAVDDDTQRVIIASDQTVIPISDNSGSITVDGTVTASIAAGATTIAKAEDVASANADVGVPAMAIQKASPADTAGTDGDYAMLQMSAGRLWVDASGVTLTVGSHAVTNAGTFAVQAAIADGAAVTLGSKADAKSTATDTTSITIMQVLKQISASVQAPPSQAVTNAGTFAVQAAATEADGANVTLGAKADAKNTATDTTAVSIVSILKQISASVQAPPGTAVTNAGTFAVQAAQSGTWTVQPGNTANTTAWKVDGSAVTQPVSAASLPLPTGASTAAKQPALGTAGSASSDVLSVQGIASMTPLTVNPSLKQLDIRQTPTIDTAAYASGDRLGAVITFANSALSSGGSGTIVRGWLEDKAQSNLEIWLHIFKVSPTLVNADNGVLDITDANLDTALYVGTIKFLTTDSKLFGASNRVTEGTWLGGPPAIGFVTSGSSSLFGIMEARGAYTGGSTSALTVGLTVIRDQ